MLSSILSLLQSAFNADKTKNKTNMYQDTDWLNICLPLAEQVEQEQYTPSEEEINEFNENYVR